MTRMCARLEIRTGRLAFRKGARSASEMQSCWLDNIVKLTGDARPRFFESYALLEEQVRRARSDDGRL